MSTATRHQAREQCRNRSSPPLRTFLAPACSSNTTPSLHHRARAPCTSSSFSPSSTSRSPSLNPQLRASQPHIKHQTPPRGFWDQSQIRHSQARDQTSWTQPTLGLAISRCLRSEKWHRLPDLNAPYNAAILVALEYVFGPEKGLGLFEAMSDNRMPVLAREESREHVQTKAESFEPQDAGV